jgi:hypothetical protein
MAILGPTNLPTVLKVASEQMKFHALSQLGFPVVNVDLTEQQLEQIIRSTGDWIAGYFPLESKYAFFMTKPLESEYPVPTDAWWIKSVAWDPAVTNINQIFSAESFLFCLDSEFKILDKDGSLQLVGEWKQNWKAKTPFGNRKLVFRKHELTRPLPKIDVDYGVGSFMATINHPVMADDKWRQLDELNIGDRLHGINEKYVIQKLSKLSATEAISIRACNSGAYYGCHKGIPILIH